jgi:hypothetical protein
MGFLEFFVADIRNPHARGATTALQRNSWPGVP